MKSIRRSLEAWRLIRPLHCSFCGRDENAVTRLVAGAAGYICDDCIGKCVTILNDHGGSEFPDKPHEPKDWQG